MLMKGRGQRGEAVVMKRTGGYGVVQPARRVTKKGLSGMCGEDEEGNRQTKQGRR